MFDKKPFQLFFQNFCHSRVNKMKIIKVTLMMMMMLVALIDLF